jgi:hypothetical protein
LDELFEGFVGAVDWPSCNLYKEMFAKWPNAKVIFTVRDPAAWQKSVLDTIYLSRHLLRESPGRFLAPIHRLLMPSTLRHMEWVNEYIWQQCFFNHAPNVRSLSGPEGLALIEKRMAEWAAEVKATIPADQLLVFRVEEGWEPLCKFLGKPVPSHPFPRVNETAEFQKMTRKRNLMWYGLPVVFVGAVGATIWAANKWLR